MKAFLSLKLIQIDLNKLSDFVFKNALSTFISVMRK